MNCLHGFSSEAGRDLHRVYCENNEAVRVELPKNEILEFVDGHNVLLRSRIFTSTHPS